MIIKIFVDISKCEKWEESSPISLQSNLCATGHEQIETHSFFSETPKIQNILK